MTRRNGRTLVFLSTGLGVGGAETQLVRIAEVLSARGWNIHVIVLITPPLDSPLAERLRHAKIPLISLGICDASSLLRGMARLIALIRRMRADVLVSFMFHANLLGRVAAYVASVPVVVSSVRTANFGSAWRYRLLKATDGLAAATVTNSQRVADSLVSRGTVRSDRVRVVPNAISVKASAPDKVHIQLLRRQLNVTENTFLWMAVGNLLVDKDYPTMLAAFALHVSNGRTATLRIVGHGVQEPALRELARTLGIEHRVGFVGFRRDAAMLLHAADGYVLSSTNEGMPNALLEAMIAGKPAIATMVGGVPEVIDHGLSGMLVAPSNPIRLAEAMEAMENMPKDARKAMGDTARNRTVEKHDLERVVNVWEGLLLDLCGRTRSHR